MKRAAYGLSALVVLVVAAALIVPSLLDWNSFKTEIANEVRKATGRTLEIAGGLEIGVLPTPHLRVSDVRFANVPGAIAPHMAILKELRASVKLIPLLSGSVEIASVELVEPVIELERHPDGSGNWEFAASPGAPAASAPGNKPGETGTHDPGGFRLDLLRIERGTIVYRNAATGSIERVENLTADMSAESLSGPFMFKGAVVIKGVPLTVDGQVSRFGKESAVPFDLSLGTPASDTRMVLKGDLTDIDSSPSVRARLEGDGGNFAGVIASFLGRTSPALLAHQFSLAATIKATADQVSVSEIEVSLGQSDLTGEITARLRDAPSIDVSLRSATMNVDEWLASGAIGPDVPDRGKNGSVSENASATPAPFPKEEAPDMPTVSFPADIVVNLTMDVTEAIVRKGRVRDIRLDAALANGAMTLSTLTATLPGGASVKLSGRATSPEGVVAFAGKSSVQTASLRSVLDWLEVDVERVPADRLRRLSLSSDIAGTAEQIQIANIDGRLDATRLKGGVTIALRERPALGASFSIDQINIDAYRGKRRPAHTSPARGAAAPATINAISPAGESSRGPLAILQNFDASLRLRVGNVSYKNAAIRDVRLDGTLVSGLLTLRDASIRNLAGTSVQVVGRLSGLQGIPAFNGTVLAASRDLTGLFNVAGIEGGVSPRKLGRMRLVAKTSVVRDRLTLDADLRLAETRTKLTGDISGMATAPVFDISLDSRHPEMSRLAAIFSDGKSRPNAGPLIFKAALKGDTTAVDVDATAELVGGALKIIGKIDALVAEPRLNMGVNLDHRDFVKFVRTFDPGYRPTKQSLGSLRVSTSIQGTGRDLVIQDLKGNVGPLKFSGSGNYVDRSPRPAINLAVKSSAIPLSDFLGTPRLSSTGSYSQPSLAIAPSTGARPSGGKWSREKIDMMALGMFDAEIDIRADTLMYRNYRVDGPEILMTLKDKILDVHRIGGKIFDGDFAMTARLEGQKIPTLKATVKVSDARVDNAFFSGDTFDIEAGNLTQRLSFSTRGNSQHDLLMHLNGNGAITVTEGVVRGFDLLTLTRALRGGGPRNLATLIPAAAASIGSSKKTRFSSLRGTVQIVNGVVSTSDMLLSSFVGDIAAAGTVNLSAWDMNLIADIRPRKVRRIPKLRLTLTGPPDQPNPRFNFDELTKDALAQGIGGLFKKVLPVGKSGGGSSSQGQRENQTDPDKVIIKNILKGLDR